MHLHKDIADLAGPSYCNGQTLIEHVTYALSNKIYSYGTIEQELDISLQAWVSNEQKNSNGVIPSFIRMQTRSGAASLILGNIFAQNLEQTRDVSPSAILATSSSLIAMKPVLDQLSLLYSSATPLVAHVSSLDLSPITSNFVSDYTRALAISREGGYAVISSSSVHEVQHMALFATILSNELPSIHAYDGIRLAREDTRVVDVLGIKTLQATYSKAQKEASQFDEKLDSEQRVAKLLATLNVELGTEYGLFEYHGAKDADTVCVVFGSPESAIAKLCATQLAGEGTKVGVVNVRVYRPFNDESFLQSLPPSTKRVAVLGQVYDSNDVSDDCATSILYADVLGALAMSDEWSQKKPTVIDVKYTREVQWRASTMKTALSLMRTQNVIDIAALEGEASALDDVRQYVQWDLDESDSSEAAAKLACIVAMDSKKNTNFYAAYDNYAEGGILQSEIKVSSKAIEATYPSEAVDLAIVTDLQVLSSFDVVASLKQDATLVLKHNLKPEALEKKFSANLKHAIVRKNINLLLLDTADYPIKDDSAVVQLLGLKLFRSDLTQDELLDKSKVMHDINSDTLKGTLEKLDQLTAHDVSAWSEVEVDSKTLPAFLVPNAFTANTEKETPAVENEKSAWQTAAKQIAFKEAYDFQSSLRPDLVEKTWQVKVQANRRLTPGSYDRNIFHIEFDITGTDLKYELGESLGVHGHNDPAQVEAFLTWYGLSAEELIRVPSRDDATIMETRTVFQALQQNVDLFGKPAKAFYNALAQYAENEDHKKVLSSLGTPEGAVDFKRRSEVETVTYADLLEEFSSAHPPIEELVKLIPPTKRREYSISSSQKVHPNSVHLLVVVVDWKDQRDRERFGQCTRYLSNLDIGSQVTVSLKPSVMKLPPRPEQPIIMAGLGTGLAPFRAFVEERAWQKAQGQKIGAVMLYLGSRHQKEEYLYGEEWEAYRDAGIITTLGQAFSRDQPKKVYIQDVMRSTIIDIRAALLGQEGSFYLCGPTWPVPDVQEVLEEAIRAQAESEGTITDSAKVIEDLKENRRYVLEVY